MQAKLQWCPKCETFNHAVIRCHVCGSVIVFQEFECTPIYNTPNTACTGLAPTAPQENSVTNGASQ